MEKAILELACLVSQSDSPIAALLWTVFVGVLVWLPSLSGFRTRSKMAQILIAHFVTLSLLSLFSIVFLPLFVWLYPSLFKTYFPFTPYPLLQLVSLGLTAFWVWLQSVQIRQKSSRENAANVISDLTRKDWITAVRLALWFTISLMPTFKGL